MAAPLPQGLVTGIDHYENFPVASVLVPARIRPAILALYRFARYADDVADEGDAPAAQRLAELDRLADALSDPPRGEHPVTRALRLEFAAHQVALDPCRDLLSAFRQDVVVTRYPDDAALRDYCARSANPVGRLVLALFGRRSDEDLRLSDAVCSALQLINFLQDIAADWERGRLYLPLNALTAADASAADVGESVRAGVATRALRRCIAERAAQAAALLDAGAGLTARVPLRLGLELRATIAGGRRILHKLARDGFDPIARRPVITWRDAPALLRLMLTRTPAPLAPPHRRS
jgi:squalene synthase HpnC